MNYGEKLGIVFLFLAVIDHQSGKFPLAWGIEFLIGVALLCCAPLFRARADELESK